MNDIQVIVLGLVVAVIVIAYAYAQRKQMEALTALIGPFAGVLETLIEGADVALVPYGATLRPVHDLAEALEALVDEEGDFLVKHLPAEVVGLMRDLVARVDALTDGKPAEG